MELYSREFGQGDPVLILHGLFGFSDNWQTIAKSLADHYLVVTPDLRNHGRSPHTEVHTYPAMADDLNAFMEAHWMFSAAVIGHSMGGKVAMQLALNYPDRVEKLVVIDIEPGPADDNHSDILLALSELDLDRITTRQEAEEFLETRIADVGTRQFLLKNITRRADHSFAWKMNLPVLRQAYADVLAPVSGPPFEKPTLFVRGGRSKYVQDAEFEAAKKLFPQAELATIADAGHWVHAEQPAELLEVLRTFLAK